MVRGWHLKVRTRKPRVWMSSHGPVGAALDGSITGNGRRTQDLSEMAEECRVYGQKVQTSDKSPRAFLCVE